MSERSKNYISDEELNEVSGGLLIEDEQWAEDIVWECLEKDYSWNDLVDNYFSLIEPYCEKVNATRVNTLKITPEEMDSFLQYKYFEIGKTYIPGTPRPKKNKR